MEELLPLLFGLLWLIYTIYNKGKKKGTKRQPAEEGEKTKAPSIIEQLFSENDVFKSESFDVYEEQEEEQLVEEIEEFKTEAERDSTPFLKAELSNFVKEGQSTFSPSIEFKESEKMKIEVEQEKIDFDLRQAIIYSEILNPPYIGYK